MLFHKLTQVNEIEMNTHIQSIEETQHEALSKYTFKNKTISWNKRNMISLSFFRIRMTIIRTRPRFMFSLHETFTLTWQQLRKSIKKRFGNKTFKRLKNNFYLSYYFISHKTKFFHFRIWIEKYNSSIYW